MYHTTQYGQLKQKVGKLDNEDLAHLRSEPGWRRIGLSLGCPEQRIGRLGFLKTLHSRSVHTPSNSANMLRTGRNRTNRMRKSPQLKDTKAIDGAQLRESSSTNIDLVIRGPRLPPAAAVKTETEHVEIETESTSAARVERTSTCESSSNHIHEKKSDSSSLFAVNMTGSGIRCDSDFEVSSAESATGIEHSKKIILETNITKSGKTIDFSLPPLHSIEDIFEDMASNALNLGLEQVLEIFSDRTINVATMCSGTESPLVALDLLSKGLSRLGRPPLRVEHHFSAEIDVTKQGYIERNCRPKRLFRDVRDFIEEGANMATTAYGAKERIPTEIDMLIAGFVCKDISGMNRHQKGIDDEGESGDTWRAIYAYVRRFRPTVVLIENVLKNPAFWDSFGEKWAAIGYDYTWISADTKNYYIPQTRQQMYMIAIDRSQFEKRSMMKASGQWKDVMLKLKRQCSSPFESFLADSYLNQTGKSCFTKALISNEKSWPSCNLRYIQIRSDQRLGSKRPFAQWRANGAVRLPDYADHA